MIQKIIPDKQKRAYLGIGLAWILVWVIPWGKLPSIQAGNFLAFLTDIIRLGVALTLFMIPGALLYILLKQGEEPGPHLPGILPIGFTLSVFLIAVVGLAGRLIGLSFSVVKYAFVLTGLVELVLLAFFKPDYVVDKKEFSSSLRSALRNPPLILAIVLATLMTFHDSLFFIDDTTYLAYLTNWQYSHRLGFMNIIHETNILEYARFWLAMYPMGQALFSSVSGVPGILLLGNYLELLLVPLAVVTSFWFGRTLGLSQKAAGFATLIQVTLYTWMVGNQFPVGMWFYQNMAEDKVSAAFLLAPVFFVFVLNFMGKPSKSNAILIFISGIGITLTHPIILFFSCAIASGIGFVAIISKRVGWREIAQLLLILVFIMLPYAIIRLSDSTGEVSGPYNGKQASTSFEIERYTNVMSDVFYGLNPEVLMFFDVKSESDLHDYFQYLRIFPIIILSLSGIFALLKLKNDPFNGFVFVSIFLVFFATIPYTGWILGYFVSARLISRISWFAPYGLGSVLILRSFIDWAKSNKAISTIIKNRSILRLNVTVLGLALCFIFVSPVLLFTIFPHVPGYFENLNHNKQLAQIGTFIDRETKNQVVSIALDYWDTQMLPGVSAHSLLISFREELDYNGFNNLMPLEKIHERMYASNKIRSLDSGISTGVRCKFIKEFGVQFVVAPSEAATKYKDIVNACGPVEIVFSTKDLVLMEIQ